MTIHREILGCVLALMLFTPGVAGAQAPPQGEVRKAAVLSTMTEAALSAVSLMRDRAGGERVREFSWTATYTERDWIFDGRGSIGNQEVRLTMSGYLWGDDKQHMTVTYAGVGQQSKEPIRLNGRSDWLYDRARSDYIAMDFRHVMKFGDNSLWGWVVGSETIIGGVVGAGAAIATASVATGGIALGAAAWIGGGGAVAGSSALVSLSQTAKTLKESSQPVPPPALPKRPELSVKEKELTPARDTIVTAVSRDGQLRGSGPDGSSVLSGKFDDKAGKAAGNISEPKQ